LKNKLSNNTKTTWLFIIGVFLIFLAVIIWYGSNQKLKIAADVYVPIMETPTPSPPVPQPTVIIDTCQEKCLSRGYETGICREYPIIEDPQICLEGEISIGQTEDCYLDDQILGAGKSCCCLQISPISYPTIYSDPMDLENEELYFPTDYHKNPAVLISTGASLWFNLVLAVLLALAIGYLMFREDIWKKRKK